MKAIASGLLLLTAICCQAEGTNEITSSASIHLLPTNSSSFFFADHLTGASYYRFDPDGRYEMIAKEHMGVWPLDAGRWAQASNGVITLVSDKGNLKKDGTDQVLPLNYKGVVFFIWPKLDYKNKAEDVCAHVDSPTNRPWIPNEFEISKDEFEKGTSKPYSFKIYKWMNKMTGAE